MTSPLSRAPESATAAPAHELAAALRAGVLTATELAEAALALIREDGRADRPVDAWASVAGEAALLSHAAAVDRDLREGVDLHPLAGIPYGVKDLLDTADLPTEAGSLRWKGRRPTGDAAAVAHARASRGLLLGKTRTHEFAAGVRTPPTANPWDRTRIPGGSSGGSAAAVAAHECVWAIGTDTLGSVRMPAALCGVVGLKPTYDLLSRDGVAPLSPTLDHVGVLARDCRDAGLALETLAGRRPGTLPPAPSGLVVGVAPDAWLDDVEPAVVAAYESAIQRLTARTRGQVRVLDLSAPDDYVTAGFDVLAAEAADWHAPLLARTPAAGEDYGADVLEILDYGRGLTPEQRDEARQRLDRLGATGANALAGADVLVIPATPFVAPRHEDLSIAWPSGRTTALNADMPRFTAFGNVTGLPALVVPVGLTGGLPLSIQLVAGRHREHELLALGSLLQQAL